MSDKYMKIEVERMIILVFGVSLIIVLLIGFLGFKSTGYDVVTNDNGPENVVEERCGQSRFDCRVNYSGKFEPEGHKILHCAGQSGISDDGLENGANWYSFKEYSNSLGDGRKPTIQMTYFTLDQDFNSYILSLNQTFNNFDDNYLGLQAGLSLNIWEDSSTNIESQIANTDEYDEIIRDFLNGLESLNRPIFLRIGLAFNADHNNYDPEDYKKAFRKFYEIRQEEELKNIAFVWDYLPYSPKNNFDYIKYYPGDLYVDWWGVQIFMREAITDINQNYKIYNFLRDAKLHGKPVMITESTPAEIGAEDSSDWDLWFDPIFSLIKKEDVVKAYCYINWNWSNYLYGGNFTWGHWGDARIGKNSELTNNYIEAMSDSIWIHATSGEEFKNSINFGNKTIYCGNGTCDDWENETNCPVDCTSSCEQTNNGIEICDGIDNDCDLEVDEGGSGLCDDEIRCTLDECRGVGGCYYTENHSICDNGLFCDGEELCSINDLGCIGTSLVDCDDEYSCTRDLCNESLDSCVSEPRDDRCSLNEVCNVSLFLTPSGCGELNDSIILSISSIVDNSSNINSRVGGRNVGSRTEEVCNETWSCSDYGDCISGLEIRNCSDDNECGTEIRKPSLTKKCESGTGTENNNNIFSTDTPSRRSFGNWIDMVFIGVVLLIIILIGLIIYFGFFRKNK
jgi:hypothetical protein